jgi:hypothetical protein
VSTVDAVFSWQQSQDGLLRVAWIGRPALTLRGPKAAEWMQRLARADATRIQLLLARATGNFKRGNER